MSRMPLIRILYKENHFVIYLGQFCAPILLVLSTFVASDFSQANAAPSIKFIQIPPSNPGGPLALGSITGRVDGPHEGLKLVLYAKSGRWYVQPFTDQPFTTIQPDSKWSSTTHLGTDYAALLVQVGYVPPAVTDSLPEIGGPVVSKAITEGTPPFWQRWWFRLLILLLAVSALVALYRWRTRELARRLNLHFEERLAERTRIAQELHDTLLQGFLSASMQLHVVAEQLPDQSAQRERLTHILKLMRQVIDEGRNAVRGFTA